MLQRFDMVSCNPVSTPMDPNVKFKNADYVVEPKEDKYPYQELIGSLLFAAPVYRPDISFTVNLLSRFNNKYEN